MSFRFRPHILSCLVAVLVGATADMAWAEDPSQPAAPELKLEKKPGALPRLESFLDEHGAISARLAEDPSLVSNPAFLKNHPPFAEFLAENPSTKDELAMNPRWFVHRELTKKNGLSQEQITAVDRYLDQHPELDKQLSQRPELVHQPALAGSQPELSDVLKQRSGTENTAETKQNATAKPVEKHKAKVKK